MSGERIFFPFLWNHFSVKIENIPYQFKSNLIDWIHDALQSPPLISSSVSTADIIFSLHCWYHLQSPLLISSSVSIADIIFSLNCSNFFFPTWTEEAVWVGKVKNIFENGPFLPLLWWIPKNFFVQFYFSFLHSLPSRRNIFHGTENDF